MVRLLSVNDNSMSQKKNIIKDFWQSFLILDLFTRLMLITVFLIITVTPYIVANNQIFTSSGQILDVGIRAFPGAEGWGAVSVGGRGGRVIEVTTLADAVPAPAGSLRACVEASGPRTCVFRVG